MKKSGYYDFEKNELIFNYAKHYKDSSLVRAYFCGIFTSNGSVNSPETTYYHLELSYLNINKSVIENDLKILNKYNFDFKSHIKTKDKTILYIKKSMLVSDFLKFLDASNSVIKFEQIRIQRDFRNSQNRIINIETSNQLKIIRTGTMQKEWIEYIVMKEKFNELSKNAKILAYIRYENESASYDELVEMMKEKSIIISKSRVATIFSDIKELFENLKGSENHEKRIDITKISK